MSGWYILDGDTPVRLPGGVYPTDEQHKVMTRSSTAPEEHIGPYRVSTVFLFLDHGHGETGVLWETMVFHDGWSEVYSDRYTSAAAARAGHAAVCERLRAGDLTGFYGLPDAEVTP